MQNGKENIYKLEERRKQALELIEKWLKEEEKELKDQHEKKENEK
jgi:hypothetical protein